VRELLFNVVKHANVANAGVQLRRAADGSTWVVVSDEGVGFDPEVLRAWDGTDARFGLFSLRERLELLGGRLDVDSAPGQGASFTIVGPPPSLQRPGTPSTPPAAAPKAATRTQTGGRHGSPARRRKR
jgi:nitrate/nitrite-specific signal transduction histidine kinase